MCMLEMGSINMDYTKEMEKVLCMNYDVVIA